MDWSRKPLTFLAVLLLGASGMGAEKKEDAPKSAEKAGKKKGKNKAMTDGKTETPAPDAADANPSRISVPVPPGHDAKGVVMPFRNAEGKMQMRFTMELGKRTDLDHMDMTTLLIETFDEDGDPELTINLPQSILNLNTRVITTETKVFIKRSDFELTGNAMEFNTETRAGRLVGKVRMLIYNLDDETNSNPEEKPREK